MEEMNEAIETEEKKPRKKRTTYTPEQKAAKIDAEIDKHKAIIKKLEAKKKAALESSNLKSLLAKAKKAGLTEQEIIEKLGLN